MSGTTNRVQFRFYGHLNHFLPSEKREVDFSQDFKGLRSVKDMIEALGVPHTEVARIDANGQPVDFAYHVRCDDCFEVYPFSVDDAASSANSLIQTLAEARFVLDVHLGRLTAHLRMIGFDSLYPEDYRDEELARISSDENRILLTRAIGLLKRRIVKHGYFVHETDPWRQLAEVLRRFNLVGLESPFSRCTQCNGRLERAEKADVSDQLQAGTLEHYEEFYHCMDCRKIYWRGSHYARLEQFLQNLKGQ